MKSSRQLGRFSKWDAWLKEANRLNKSFKFQNEITVHHLWVLDSGFSIKFMLKKWLKPATVVVN